MPQTLKTGTLYMMVGLVISMGVGYSAQVIASRSLGPESYGLYGLVLANVALIAGLVDPGLSAAMATFVAEQDANNGRFDVIRVINSGVILEFTISMLVIIFVLIFFQSITERFFAGNQILTIFFLVLVILRGYYGLFAGTLQGLRELKGLAFIRVFEQLCFFLLLLIAIIFFYLRLLSILVMQVAVGSLALISSLLLVWYYVHHLRKSEQIAQLNTKRLFDNFPEIIRFAVPVSLAAFTNSIVLASGPIVMNFLTNNTPGNQLGIFVVILILARALNRMITTFFRSAFPYLVKWNAQGDIIKTKQYTNIMTYALIVGYFILLLLLLIFGQEIINIIYGEAYLEVAYYLPLAIVVFCIISLREVYKVALYSIKKPGVYLVVNLIGVGVYFLSILFGNYIFMVQDIIILLLISMGISSLFVTIGSIIIYRKKFRFQEDQIILPSIIE